MVMHHTIAEICANLNMNCLIILESKLAYLYVYYPHYPLVKFLITAEGS